MLNHAKIRVLMSLVGRRIKKFFKLNPNQRGCMRSILGGAVPTGERLLQSKV